MKLEIKTYGDTVLREPVQEITSETKFLVNGETLDLKTFIDSMFETMYSNAGIGLAAPQVGVSYSLFIVDVEIRQGIHFKSIFINPKIIDKYGTICSMEEGCLSVPGIHQYVNRFGSILIHYYDENFKKHYEFFHDIQSRVIQHEYDHLNGILFTDYGKEFSK